ncbi:M24 family metallopeptidase [Desulfovirgula thermocuniculi]|uniref:M24 family metallopeptidase n=1 Tax=Desulfovirgula thermocuniculi TaxID=348842 RepID=UPI0012EC6B49|nr:Xaa-Pro peptidase family protein [Desulfovirgula thermocuniculi]
MQDGNLGIGPEERWRRLRAVQDHLVAREIDLLLVVGRENLIYFTGTTQIECAALLIPAREEPCLVALWLDAPYLRELTGLAVEGYVFPGENLGRRVARVIKRLGYGRPVIGFEKYFVEFSVFEALREEFPEARFVGAGDILYRVRAVKSAEEIACIRQACRLVVAGVEAAVRFIRPGVSELEVVAEAEYAMLRRGSGGSPFRPQVVAGERALLTHPCATNRPIKEGEIVVVHLGATWNGYCAKMCRTVAVGRVPEAQVACFELIKKAQEAAINVLRPGVKAAEVDRAAREIIAAAGYEKHYLTYVGYGVGLRQSEFYPIIGKDSPDEISAGMVVDLLLPTVYLPGFGGPRLTDCLLVTETGAELLTPYPRELIQVM